MSDNSYQDDQHPLLKHFRTELRRLRQKRGWTQQTLAVKLDGWTEDTVGHIELGRRNPTMKFAKAVDRVFGTGDAYEQLVKKAGAGDAEDEFADWVSLEGEAVIIRTWEPVNIPGLLQTEAYAQAVYEAWLAVDGDRNPGRDVAKRMERQKIFARQPPPLFTAIIDESVLRRPVGGAVVMRGQLRHLLEMSVLPRVSIHILPGSTGAHVGSLGSFVIVSFASGRVDSVYEETSSGHGRVTANPDATARVSTIFNVLRADVLNAHASREKIENNLEEQWPE